MALIGKIRRNSWILIVLLGGALAAFVIMDMTSNNSQFAGGQFNIAEVGDRKIGYNDFQNMQAVLYQNTASNVFEQRDYLFNYFIEEAIVLDESDALGLKVGATELNELQFGANLSPIIRQRFTNPTTGVLDVNQLNSFRSAIQSNQLAPEYRALWSVQEKEVVKDRLQTKLLNLVLKGIYTPTWQAEMRHIDEKKTYDFTYVQIPYDEIDDTEVQVSDDEIRDYIRQYSVKYTEKDEMRNIAFVAFDVFPTELDTFNLLEQMTNLKAGFEEAENDTVFIENNYGTFDPAFYKYDEIDPAYVDSIFDLPIGTVYGPYIDNNSYQLTKILDRKIIPDSVKVRHIIRTASTQQEYISAAQFIDSLLPELKNEAIAFDSAAIKFSQGPTSVDGGDLGWAFPNQMVKSFNDLIFFVAEVDTLYTLVTEFGVHIVQVTGKKFLNNDVGIRYATIEEPIVPSEETQNAVYENAQDFLSDYRTLDDILSGATDGSFEVNESGYVGRNDAIIFTLDLQPNSTARDMISWAFSSPTKIGDVSPIVYALDDQERFFTSKYVVAALKDVQKPGLKSLESVRGDVELVVRNQKKGDLILQRIGSSASMEAIASQFGSQIDTATNIAFSSGFVAGLGTEPKVIGTLSKMTPGVTSDPIKGTSGIFIIHCLDMIEPFQDPDIAALRRSEGNNLRSLLPISLMNSIRKKVKIKDNRSTFF